MEFSNHHQRKKAYFLNPLPVFQSRELGMASVRKSLVLQLCFPVGWLPQLSLHYRKYSIPVLFLQPLNVNPEAESRWLQN